MAIKPLNATDPTADYIPGKVRDRGTGREGYRWECQIWVKLPMPDVRKKLHVTIHEDGNGGPLRVEGEGRFVRPFMKKVEAWAQSIHPDEKIIEPLTAWVSYRIFGATIEEAFEHLIHHPPPDLPTSVEIFNNRTQRFLHTATLTLGALKSLDASCQAGKVHDLFKLQEWAVQTITAWHEEGRLDVDDWMLFEEMGHGHDKLWSVHIDCAQVWGDCVHPEYDDDQGNLNELKLVFAGFASVPELRSGTIPGVKVLTLYHRPPTTFHAKEHE